MPGVSADHDHAADVVLGGRDLPAPVGVIPAARSSSSSSSRDDQLEPDAVLALGDLAAGDTARR